MSNIIYLIGASGSGKDSILAALREQVFRQQISDKKSVIVAHRYITRNWLSGSENHIQLSENEFMQRQEHNLFALYWHANGLSYGIGREIDLWLEQDFHVIVNGSREYLPTAQSLYPDQLIPVLIKVDQETLAQRLELRGREKPTEIKARLERLEDYAEEDQCHIIDNNQSLDHAVQQLQDFIASLNKK